MVKENQTPKINLPIFKSIGILKYPFNDSNCNIATVVSNNFPARVNYWSPRFCYKFLFITPLKWIFNHSGVVLE